MATSIHGKEFINYPESLQGPDIPYKKNRKESPALRGLPLVIGAFLLEWLPFLRGIFWRNAGFGNLRPIRKYLEDHEPRFDPTVVPLENKNSSGDTKQSETNSSSNDQILIKKLPGTIHYSVADYQALYTLGEVTPTAVAKSILRLIRRDLSPAGEHSVAWADVRADLVLAAAEASTLRYKNGYPLGPLDGVPTGIKDEVDLDGHKTYLGSLTDYTTKVAPGQSVTSWCVKKLEESGAVILGKLAMHEFGLDTSGNNPNHGTPPNPFNPNYYTGGSSSGCAYAVSAGLIPIALGGDGGGSIRIPSSFCSVYGLKTTHGRISLLPGSNHSNTCAINGPIAADTQSLAALLNVIGAPHPTSHFPLVSPSRLILQPDRNKILGLPEAWFSQSDPAVQSLCRSLLDKLVSVHNYTIVPITIPFLVEGQTAHAMTVLTDAATLLPDTRNITAPNKVMLALGNVTPSTDFLLAQKLRQLLMQHLAHLWKKHPGMIIVTPTTSSAGWRMKSKSELKYGVSDGDQTLKSMEYVWMANFMGIPALSAPAGFVDAVGGKKDSKDEGKIPVGLMGMSEWAGEEALLQWSLDVTDVGAERLMRPPIWVDVVENARAEMESE